MGRFTLAIIIILLILLLYIDLKLVLLGALGWILITGWQKADLFQLKEGGGWLCDTRKEFGNRCVEHPPSVGMETKSECESFCYTSDELVPNIENILKMTQGINFPIPREFLESIDQEAFQNFLDNQDYMDVYNMLIYVDDMREYILKSETRGVNYLGEICFMSAVIGKEWYEKYKKKLEELTSKTSPLSDDETDLRSELQFITTQTEQYGEFSCYFPLILKEFNPNIFEVSKQTLEKSRRPNPIGLDMIHLILQGDVRHSNFLLVDHGKKIIYHFEPNVGSGFAGVESCSKYHVFRNLEKEGYTFHSLTDGSCPRSLQVAEGDKFCQTWTMFGQILYVNNINWDKKELLGWMMKLGPSALDILKIFMYYIWIKYKDRIINIEENNPIIYALYKNVYDFTKERNKLYRNIEKTFKKGESANEIKNIRTLRTVMRFIVRDLKNILINPEIKAHYIDKYKAYNNIIKELGSSLIGEISRDPREFNGMLVERILKVNEKYISSEIIAYIRRLIRPSAECILI